MHEEYFEPQQAPIVLIKYETKNLASDSVPEMWTLLQDNEFKNNKHIQIEVIELKFKGSLIQFSNNLPLCHIDIKSNSIQRNVFFGDGSGLISIDNGIMKIEDNYSINNGYISLENVYEHPGSVEYAEGELQLFPYSQYIYQKSQTYGVFAFYFEQEDLPDGYTHLITRNFFSHNLCLHGCAYNSKGFTV